MLSVDDVSKRLLYELNPENDVDSLFNNFDETARDPVLFLSRPCVYAIKHVVRGAVVGALLGAATSCVTGSNMWEGIDTGYKIGATIDAIQYVVRISVGVIKKSRNVR